MSREAKPVVHVWFAGAAAFPAGAAGADDILTTVELGRYGRLRRERDKTLYLAAHLTVRAALARATQTAARAWRIEYDSEGRPLAVAAEAGAGDARKRKPEDAAVGPSPVREPADAAPPAISISHTTGLVACAVGHADALGIDVEPVDRRVNAPAIARRDFSERERAELALWPDAQRTRRFLEYWTLKEAYLKARGIGMRIPLRDVDVVLTGDSDVAELAAHTPGSTDPPCALRLLPAPPGYVAALAVASALGDFEIRQHEASASDLLVVGDAR